MDDVIGVKVRDEHNNWFGFMTYPEIYQAFESNGKDFLAVAKPFMQGLEGMGEPVEVVVSSSVRPIESARHFYQGLFRFCWNVRPQKFNKYRKWEKGILKDFQRSGYWFYFVGALDEPTRITINSPSNGESS